MKKTRQRPTQHGAKRTCRVRPFLFVVVAVAALQLLLHLLQQWEAAHHTTWHSVRGMAGVFCALPALVLGGLTGCVETFVSLSQRLENLIQPLYQGAGAFLTRMRRCYIKALSRVAAAVRTTIDSTQWTVKVIAAVPGRTRRTYATVYRVLIPNVKSTVKNPKASVVRQTKVVASVAREWVHWLIHQLEDTDKTAPVETQPLIKYVLGLLRHVRVILAGEMLKVMTWTSLLTLIGRFMSA